MERKNWESKSKKGGRHNVSTISPAVDELSGSKEEEVCHARGLKLRGRLFQALQIGVEIQILEIQIPVLVLIRVHLIGI